MPAVSACIVNPGSDCSSPSWHEFIILNSDGRRIVVMVLVFYFLFLPALFSNEFSWYLYFPKYKQPN